MSHWQPPEFPFVAPPEIGATERRRVPIAIVGAGPVGLCAAIDLALHGIESIVLDDDNTVSTGSRAICWAKRALEILDRLGVAEPMVAKGVTWNTGKVFFDDAPLYDFDLADEGAQKHPAFINLQQYFAEADLVTRAAAIEAIDLRWKNRVADVTPIDGGVVLAVETPAGAYELEAETVIAADGARSTVRRALGLDFEGRVFEDRFLIADVRMTADFPSERWFWFDPPFNRGQSALLHQQADNVWRIDLQLGRDADPEIERRPERVIPRIKRMLGDDARFELEWTSVYTFQCRRLKRFRHGRVFFAGDAAHQVSPFGARGANSGIQDIDNLVWKLALVHAGEAPDALLDTYDDERIYAADENILNSTRSTDFITPKSAASRALRDATLHLARDWPFARALVNSGRLSRPATYHTSPLNGPATGGLSLPPGAPCPNPPVRILGDSDDRPHWLLDLLGGNFAGLFFVGPTGTLSSEAADALRRLGEMSPTIQAIVIGAAPQGLTGLANPAGALSRVFGAAPGGFALVRPDQHMAAHWKSLDLDAVAAALARATAQTEIGP